MANAVRWMFALALGGLIASAQAPAPNLVRMNVTVTDAQGASVIDLKADDIQIADQGKTQKIIYFKHLDAKAQPAAAGLLSNRTAPKPLQHIVFLMDMFTQNRTDAFDASRQLAKSLAEMSSGENVYLYLLAFDGTLHPMHALPGDAAYKPAENKTWHTQMVAEMENAIKTLGRAKPAGIDHETMVKKSYVTLETLAKSLSALPGRREIVYVTNGVPMEWDPKNQCVGDWIDCSLYVNHLAFTLDRAETSVNPMGLGGTLMPNANRDMEMLAGLTNGRAFFSASAKTVVDRLNEAAANDYIVAYSPAAETMDQKFHKLKVTTDHKSAKLTTRNRMFAYPEGRAPMAKAQGAIIPLMNYPGDEATIGVEAAAAPAADGKAVQLKLRIHTPDLLLQEEGGSYVGHVTVLFANYNATGVAGAPVPRDFGLKLTKAQYEQVTKEGLTFAQDQAIDASVQRVKVIVYDHGTGLLGSLTVPVKR